MTFLNPNYNCYKYFQNKTYSFRMKFLLITVVGFLGADLLDPSAKYRISSWEMLWCEKNWRLLIIAYFLFFCESVKSSWNSFSEEFQRKVKATPPKQGDDFQKFDAPDTNIKWVKHIFPWQIENDQKLFFFYLK